MIRVIPRKNNVFMSIVLISMIIIIHSLGAGSNSVSTADQVSFDPGYTIVSMDTSKGSIMLALYEDMVPVTVQNFVDLISIDFFDGIVFHRVIDDFVIQGGGFDVNHSYKRSPFDPIELEIHPDARHIDGAIGMARTSDPDSATSQFYICDGAQHFLDDNYAVFGVVIQGIEVVREIASVETTTKRGMKDWPVDDIVITDITILSQNVLYVDDDNTVGPWDGTEEYPFQTIQDAIDHADSYDIIFVFNGTYSDPITMTLPLQLIGETREKTIISFADDANKFFVNNVNGAFIKNFSFVCSDDDPSDILQMVDSTFCTIQNLTFIAETQQQSALSINGSNNMVKDISISGNQYQMGIEEIRGNNNIMKHNNISSCSIGLYSLRSHGNNISFNEMGECGRGVYIEEGTQNWVSYNSIDSNDIGLFLSYTASNTIQNNDFINNVEQAKFSKLLKTGFITPNTWSENYWDDFNGGLVRPIPGIMYISNNLFIPWFEFDWQPSSKPNI